MAEQLQLDVCEPVTFYVVAPDGRVLDAIPQADVGAPWNEAVCWAYLAHHRDRELRPEVYRG